MFFGTELKKDIAYDLFTTKQTYCSIQLSNVALSKNEYQAHLYLKILDQQILICQLNRSHGILHTSLNLILDSKQEPALFSKNGNCYVCGYYQSRGVEQNKVDITGDKQQQNTNKKNNALESRLEKRETLPAQKLSCSINHESSEDNKNSVQIQQRGTAIRQSSRLSSRRHASNTQAAEPVIIQFTQKHLQNKQKMEQKRKKKQNKQSTVLKNGRYSLKALLQNISDSEDDDSDQEFSNSGEQDQSDDDDSESSNYEEDDEKQKPKKRIKDMPQLPLQEPRRALGRFKPQEQIQKRPRRQKLQTTAFPNYSQLSTLTNPFQTKSKKIVQIGEEPEDEIKQPRTQDYQERWPQNIYSVQQKQANRKERIIEQLASQIKVPTKKPTI